MTRVFDRRITGTALHALVIGVGRYPHCGPGAPSALLQLPDLPGAARTAVAMARWLVDEQAEEKALPLASLELLVSADTPVTFDDGHRVHEVEPATREAVRQGFDRWYERCDSEDSTALLYFCGHGVALDGLQHALLLEDFGRAGRNPFEDALDFVRTYEGMRGCAAPVQCYFVDACRELVPFEYLNQLNAWAPASLTNQLHRRTTDLVLYSTGYGQESYAPREGDTYFSQAVRAAFAGAGARRGHDGLWRVTTAGLGNGVRELMNHLPHATAPRHGRADAGWTDVLQQRAAQDGNPGDAVLRELPGRPKVPFTISCDVHEAQREAELSLLDLGGEQALRHRPRGDAGPWRGEIEADAYDLLARFPEERWHDEHLPREFVVPPSYPRSIPVRLT
ncbi:caspase family protein [Streptomyces bacillaris]|uniref:caspase family protein n=1 Tax=Streptomyces bacillaris TaxID=68179 RepID=UPI00345FBB37